MASWREILPTHPAAELFPLMTADELRALGEDIKRHGLTSQIAIWEKAGDLLMLLDGRNRLDAMEAVGIKIVIEPCGTKRDPDIRLWYCFDYEPERKWPIDSARVRGNWHQDPYAYVISANIHRRHLKPEQKRELIATLIKAQPEKSDRQIAETVKVDHKTVGAVRAQQEATGEIPQLKSRVGADGKSRQQPARKTSPKPIPPAAPSTPPEARQAKFTVEQAKASGKLIGLLERADEAVQRDVIRHLPPKMFIDRDDVGPASPGEIARKDARIEELENEIYRLKRSLIALQDEIGGGKSGLAEKLEPYLAALAEEGRKNQTTMCVMTVAVAVCKLERLLVEYGVIPPSRRIEDPKGYLRLKYQQRKRQAAANTPKIDAAQAAENDADAPAPESGDLPQVAS